MAAAGLVVGDPQWFGGGNVPRQPDGDPVYGEQFRGVANHGEGIHERCHEDQGGRLPGRISLWACVDLLHAAGVSMYISSAFQCGKTSHERSILMLLNPTVTHLH